MQIFVATGRCVNDVETRTTQGGMVIAQFTVACDRYNAKKLKDEGKQATDFFNCVVFGKKAEYIATYLKKGKLVEVQGEVNIDQVKKDNETKYYTKVICSTANVLEYVKKEEQPTSYNENDFMAMDDTENCPF